MSAGPGPSPLAFPRHEQTQQGGGGGQGQQMYDMAQGQVGGGGGGGEDYWTQMPVGNKGIRTGFTPGASVNLDELFGGGDGWGAAGVGGGMWDSPGFR